MNNAPGNLGRRSLQDALAPLDKMAAESPNLTCRRGARFVRDGQEYELPRYLFIGPKGGDEPIRIGIFAGIHGDETEGVHGLVRFLRVLDARPELASGYCLFIYPICNPTGFEDGTRHSRSGKDLNREFWTNSSEPEVKLLEDDLATHSFHGLIGLHTDDTSDGFYGFVAGATLTTHLLEPALRSVSQVLPLNTGAVIDGFNAQNGIIYEGYRNILSAPPEVQPRPFEIILETPKGPPQYLAETAYVMALETILAEYRNLMAFAPNL